jgi:GDP-mannose 6-dehydrogenase
MRISVFGIGYVGAVSCGCLARLGHEVIGVDIAAEKVARLAKGHSPIVEAEIDDLLATALAAGRLSATTDTMQAVAESDVSFISVGTPSNPDGSADLRAVEQVLRQIGAAIRAKGSAHTVVMRSTVPPGTAEARAIPLLEEAAGRRLGDGLAYYANPEFLREGSSVRDFFAPPLTLIGVPADDDAVVLRAAYAGIDAPVHLAPYRVAESVKCLGNAFHALKVAFANEAGAVLAASGVDARAAFALFRADTVLNVSPAYLRPGFAFGGSCLPKDLRGFLAVAREAGVSTPLLSHILPANEAVVERAFQEISRHGRQRVSLFGLAFKPGTDDLRESPFVLLAERLIGRGFDVRIFDRNVELARLTGGNRAYIEREIPHLERLLAGSPAEALAESRMAVIGHIGAEDRPALLAALNGQTVLDLAGIDELARHPGIAYQGFCW